MKKNLLFTLAAMGMLAFSGTAFAQSADNLLAYGSQENTVNSVDDDILAAMMALDEVGSILEEKGATKQADAVEVDDLIAAANAPQASANKPENVKNNGAEATPKAEPKPEVVVAAAPKAEPKHDAQTAPVKEPKPEVVAAAPKAEPKHDVQTAPVKEPKPEVVAATPKAEPKHDVQTAPAKAPKPEVVAAVPKAEPKPTVVAAAAPKAEPKPEVVVAAPKAEPKHDVQTAPAKEPKPEVVVAAAPKAEPKHDVQTAPVKEPKPEVVAAAPKAEPKHDVQTAPVKEPKPEVVVAAAPKAKFANTKGIAPDGTHVTTQKQTSGQAPNVETAAAPHVLSLGYVKAVYKLNGVDLDTAGKTIAEVYQFAFSRKLVYQSTKPAIGDLVFFHNTVDRNRDGLWNDWHSLVGIVETIDKDETISVLVFMTDKVDRIYLNLKYPELHKGKKGQVLNSQLRNNEGAQKGTSAKLFAGFANLLGDASSVTVIDNWKPGMKIK